jgi:hypothetical protein
MFDYKHYNSLDEMLTDEGYMLKKRIMLLTRIAINERGCWNYTRYCDPEGRAKTQIGYKSIPTARLSYIVFKKRPIGNKFVCHSCDNPSCINPEHLWLGTHQDNMADRDVKGRCQRPTGTKNNKCKLTETHVREIRLLRSTGLSYSAISRKFNLSAVHVRHICLRHNWKHVK